MNTAPTTSQTSHLIDLLQASDLFNRYREAFRLAHGCALRLVSEEEHQHGELSSLPFVTEMCLPVLLEGRTLAHLCVDPIRIAGGKASDFDAAARQMLDEGCTAAQLRTARKCFDKLPVMSQQKAGAVETMLQLFAEQLGGHAERLFLQAVDNDPEPVKRARTYILAHLTDSMALEEVAEHAGVSPFHFCKVFKRATGLTFTEFVNKARVEEAKRLLLKPQARITEVAYDVGFQSLSQFNRSFRRVTAQSPTEYRVHQRHPVLSAA
jgi:AraC-like DNA-binding protein